MISFCKYEALGNDFVLVDYKDSTDYCALSKKLCDRHNGIGADGLIAVANALKNPQMYYYNADGSRAAMCANGIRCVAAYCVYKSKKEKRFVILTDDGEKEITIKNENPFLCTLFLGKAVTDGLNIGLNENTTFWGQQLDLKDARVRIWFVKTGVPHAVIINENFLTAYADEIHKHPLFADKTNVDFVTVKDKNNITVKTYERGAGWTKACGTGAAASAAVCQKLGLIEKTVNVFFEQGSLLAQIIGEKVFLTGGANFVFEGNFKEE